MERLLTVQEMYKILSVKKSTIYQWTHEGFIPHIKVGRFVRFKEEDIKSWLRGQQISGRKAHKSSLQ